MRVAVATLRDPEDLRTWSGTPAHMCRGFRENGVEVVPIGPLRAAGFRTYRRLAGLRNRLLPRRHEPERDHWVLRRYGRDLDRQLANAGAVDVVIAPGSQPVSYSRTSVPVIVWADATMVRMLGYYDDFSSWTKRSVRSAITAEQRALDRCTYFVGASQWASDSVQCDYGLNRQRVAVVPFGANLQSAPPAIKRTPVEGPIRLLTVGASWSRKGMDVAVEAMLGLQRRGYDARLDVVGARPPGSTSLPDGVRLHGVLRKDVIEHHRTLEDLYTRAHFFILPTRAECFGVVFCEAASYSLPVIASNTGGVPSAVTDGVTGVLVSEESGPNEYIRAVEQLSDDRTRYVEMSRAARLRYEQTLNWRVACAQVLAIAATLPR